MRHFSLGEAGQREKRRRRMTLVGLKPKGDFPCFFSFRESSQNRADVCMSRDARSYLVRIHTHVAPVDIAPNRLSVWDDFRLRMLANKPEFLRTWVYGFHYQDIHTHTRRLSINSTTYQFTFLHVCLATFMKRYRDVWCATFEWSARLAWLAQTPLIGDIPQKRPP